VGAAVSWFAAEGVELIVVAGDVVELPDEAAFSDVLAALAAGLPVGVVAGNHDGPINGLLGRTCANYGVELLGRTAVAGVRVVGQAAAPAVESGLYTAAESAAGDGARVIVSHFPVLSEAERLAAAGLPYPGDMIGRAGLEERLQGEAVPLVVLSGHIHARCAQARTSVLQLTAGALIEPPYEAAIVEVDLEEPKVTRCARRLGPAAAVDPVFAGDEEHWEWRRSRWMMAASSS
jgi:predicted phosphodiesterase